MKWTLHLMMLVSVGHKSPPTSLALVMMNCSTHGFNHSRNVLYVSVEVVGGCMGI